MRVMCVCEFMVVIYDCCVRDDELNYILSFPAISPRLIITEHVRGGLASGWPARARRPPSIVYPR